MMLVLCLSVSLTSSLVATRSAATWITDGVPVYTTTYVTNEPCAIGDGGLGAIIGWSAHMTYPNQFDVWVQCIDWKGDGLWGSEGVQVTDVIYDQLYPVLVGDGTGGGIAAWADHRGGSDYDVYAQRISADGQPLWAPNGIAICTTPGDSPRPEIVADGQGGAIISWCDHRDWDDSYGDIYAQRIDADGNVLWQIDGVPVCVNTGNQDGVEMGTDGAGGAVLSWFDQRSGNDIYAQRIDGSGAPLWLLNGVVVCNESHDQLWPRLAVDGTGGAIILWHDEREGHFGLWAQRLNGFGYPQWPANGIAIAHDPGYGHYLIASDGSGGAIIGWDNSNSSATSDIYAQRVGPTGSLLWTAGGRAVCTAAAAQWIWDLVSDATGQAYVSWMDERGETDWDVYVQGLRPDGSLTMPAGGVGVCLASQDQTHPHLALRPFGAIVAWEDQRNDIGGDIYAQRVHINGALGLPPLSGADQQAPATELGLLHAPVPNPFNPSTTLSFDLPEAKTVRLSIYDIGGRLVRELVSGLYPMGRHTAVWDGKDSVGRSMASGVYFARLQAGGRIETVRLGLVR